MKRWFVLALLAAALHVAPALAQSPSPAPTATAKPGSSEGWVADDRAANMHMGDQGFQSTTMVTASYAFIWLAVLAFVASVWMRSGKVEREMAELAERIRRAEGTPGSGTGKA